MPTYDYECQSCGEVFEKFHSMAKRPRVKCPLCGGRAKKLLGTGAGIIFKGSGFYETDYRRKTGAAAGKERSSDGNGSGASEGGTESKPKESGASANKESAKAVKSESANSGKQDK